MTPPLAPRRVPARRQDVQISGEEQHEHYAPEEFRHRYAEIGEDRHNVIEGPAVIERRHDAEQDPEYCDEDERNRRQHRGPPESLGQDRPDWSLHDKRIAKVAREESPGAAPILQRQGTIEAKPRSDRVNDIRSGKLPGDELSDVARHDVDDEENDDRDRHENEGDREKAPGKVYHHDAAPAR
jgi:hypothetical protein